MADRLAGKVALVTGASRGIGKAVAIGPTVDVHRHVSRGVAGELLRFLDADSAVDH